MNRRIYILTVSAIGILAMGFLCSLLNLKSNDFTDKQEELAQNLGVNIQDYPSQSQFPTVYFYDILKPGMTYGEVHKIVRWYEKVYRCYGTDEIYYYFGTEEKDALRFALYYDEQGRFIELQGEDPNSLTLGLGPGCSVGLLGEP